jgi:hypothetical protein
MPTKNHAPKAGNEWISTHEPDDGTPKHLIVYCPSSHGYEIGQLSMKASELPEDGVLIYDIKKQYHSLRPALTRLGSLPSQSMILRLMQFLKKPA